MFENFRPSWSERSFWSRGHDAIRWARKQWFLWNWGRAVRRSEKQARREYKATPPVPWNYTEAELSQPLVPDHLTGWRRERCHATARSA
jgi:hypothetical protein